jgi:hypothetical protein
MRNNIGWDGWSSGYNYIIYSSTTTNVSQTVQTVFKKSQYEIWIEALGKLLEEGYEIDIVTGGVINA